MKFDNLPKITIKDGDAILNIGYEDLIKYHGSFIVADIIYSGTVFAFIAIYFFQNIKFLSYAFYMPLFKSDEIFPFIVATYFKDRFTGI